MTTFAIVSSVPLSGVISMPALGVFLAWLMITVLAASVAGLLVMVLPRTSKDNSDTRTSGSIGFGAKLAHHGAV